MARIFPILGTALYLSATFPLVAAGDDLALPAAPAPGGGLLRQIDEGFVAVYEKVSPAVVVIESFKAERDEAEAQEANEPFDFFRSPHAHPPGRRGQRGPDFRLPEPSNRSEGSGFILRQDGYIVTNYHVVEGAERITVRLRDGRKFPAKLVGSDEHTDIAVVRIEAEKLPALPLADSGTVRVGQLVCAIGVPFKLDFSFSIGCVSGLKRSGLSSLTYEDYIQTDAFINPGNSGGPLVDVDGNVLGMNTLINGLGRGLAFAIPSNMIRDVATQLITDGRVRRAALGIRIETLSDESSLREQIKGVEKGVVVNTIEPDSAAARGGLNPMDVITAVDGQPVTSAQELQKEVLKAKVGQELKLTIWRDGKETTLPVVTGELPVSRPTARLEPPLDSGDAEELLNEAMGHQLHGMQIEAAPAERVKKAKVKAAVAISGVAPMSAAEEAQLLVGDLILEIDGTPVASVDDVRKAFSERKESYVMSIERDGSRTYAVLKTQR